MFLFKKSVSWGIFAALAWCLCLSPSAEAAWLWSPESNDWTNVKDIARDTPEEQFSVAKGYFDNQDMGRAEAEFEKVIRVYPNSKWAAEAQFHIGLIEESKGDVSKAAAAFKALVDKYPYSERLNDAVEHEYELAEAMMGGKKSKFLGMEIMPAQDLAADLYRHIVRTAPYGPYGVLAQYRLGDAEMAFGNFDEARRAYQAVIDEYPNSEYAPKAKYKIAQVTYDTALSEQYHGERTEEALQKFEGFKRAYPESAMQFEADDAIKELREKQAQSVYDVAVFYDKIEKYKSARMYYAQVAQGFPETMFAREARKRIEAIDAFDADPEAAGRDKILGLIPTKPPVRTSKEIIKGEEEGKVKKPADAPKPKFLGIF
ncbi:MAG: outer membrane protein assembly factor BamD [Candidatus Omnitrophica bacterium]|nr:outer membrane protein assembly factor BamD [Candidatus Omnitrophota bacterium]